jgi:hypothetical protein
MEYTSTLATELRMRFNASDSCNIELSDLEA